MRRDRGSARARAGEGWLRRVRRSGAGAGFGIGIGAGIGPSWIWGFGELSARSVARMPPAMGTMREVSGVTSSMAVRSRSREVEGVALHRRSSHWSGSKSPSGLSRLWGCWCGGQVPDADDAALDGAAEAVGVGEQRGLRRWSGLICAAHRPAAIHSAATGRTAKRRLRRRARRVSATSAIAASRRRIVGRVVGGGILPRDSPRAKQSAAASSGARRRRRGSTRGNRGQRRRSRSSSVSGLEPERGTARELPQQVTFLSSQLCHIWGEQWRNFFSG